VRGTPVGAEPVGGPAQRAPGGGACRGHQQVVVKSIEESYGSVPGIAGATILGNGRVAFILDVEKLSDLAANEMPSIGSPALANAGPTEIAAMN